MPLYQPHKSKTGNDKSLYKTAEWRVIRDRRKACEPFCRMCKRVGIETRMYIVDHIKPHRGDRRLFFDYLNTQSLCKQHHDSMKQSQEVRGFSRLIDDSGFPADPRHPFNQRY